MKEVNVNQDEDAELKHDQLVVFVPHGCVKENTTLVLSVKEDWAWDNPFKVAFNDGQQPQRPVEIFVRTAGDILEKSIVLCHLPNYEEGGQEEEVIDNDRLTLANLNRIKHLEAQLEQQARRTHRHAWPYGTR